MKKTLSVLLSLGLLMGVSTATGVSDNAEAATAKVNTKNCTEFNKTYSKGVAKSSTTKNKVVDRKTKKVSYKPLSKGTKISSTIYKDSIKKNADLDRDKDGIACEK